jgi:hypothetical protein
MSVSGETTCDSDKVCVAVTGSVPVSVTGAVCLVKCGLLSMSATGSTSVGVSGSICTDGEGKVTASLGGLTVTGTATVADTFEVFSYTYVAWSPESKDL